MKNILFFTVAVFVFFVLNSCKKYDDNTDYATAYSGPWFASDTLDTNSYGAGVYFRIEKKDNKNVYLNGFMFPLSIVFSVNANNMTYLSGGGSYADFYSSMVFTVRNDTLYYTRMAGVIPARGRAVRR